MASIGRIPAARPERNRRPSSEQATTARTVCPIQESRGGVARADRRTAGASAHFSRADAGDSRGRGAGAAFPPVGLGEGTAGTDAALLEIPVDSCGDGR